MATATKAATGRYTRLLERMTRTLENVREERVRASEPLQILLLDNKHDNLEEAISLFTRAEEVEPVRRQFGSPDARTLKVWLPPMIDEFKFKPIQFQRYVYATDEPVELLYLRELMNASPARIEGLTEMEPGLLAAVSKDGILIGYFEEARYTELGRAGVLKSQIG
jgi:hypothetical protein